jgi:GNAT superfamily N-acetyltransferase
MNIRPATSADIPGLMQLEHGYRTDHVWQMAYSPSARSTSITFREVKLPRPMRVSYPRDPGRLADEWTNASEIFVAEADHTQHAYVVLDARIAPDTGWVTDLVVAETLRRKGIATRLLATARRWCNDHGLTRLTVEMQSKNFPFVSLAQKLGFVLSGYHDKYYPDEEIALFFTLNLR